MSSIALTLAATTVTVTDGRAALTASVTNGSPVPARIVLGAFGPLGAGGPGPVALPWTSIDRPLREIAAGATEQYTVAFAPPAGTASGSYPVRFIAYSADQAPEEHADQAKQVDIVIPATPPTPPPKKPWWPYAVAAALVLVAAVVGWLVLRAGDGPEPTPTPVPPTSATPTPTTPTPPPPTVPLEGTVWGLTAFDGGVALVPGTKITLTLGAGSVKGRACNAYNAAATWDDSGAIKVNAITSTMMLCLGEGVMAQEQRYFKTLRSVTMLARQADLLTLTSPDGHALSFKAQ